MTVATPDQSKIVSEINELQENKSELSGCSSSTEEGELFSSDDELSPLSDANDVEPGQLILHY